MAHIKATVSCITRVHCDNLRCPVVYDYTGPKSTSFALTEAEAFGWKQRGPFFVCPEHSNTPAIER
jgi:hypothetical protein